ncbi:MAG: fumarate reductase/succinate dehydrogenase flavoprotein subunit [Verrucomicrobiota bacterium JB022]|nr:fumarate reductase/succinate dehydrogenase flavoprotein subunit [Verrucomicrobiota bacterium JB022]
MNLDPKIPEGPLAQKWTSAKFKYKLVNPANKRKYHIIVVGSGLAGGAGAATLGELGYNVSCFCYQDSPRRAHSIAAQGGINAAKNYQNDGDSVYRLFYDTVKGGDFRSREANVYRLAEVSTNIIDQCVAQGVPFAREYGGMLANRSFGGAQVSRTFYARGQTGQQLLLGAYQSLSRQIGLGQVKMYNRHEMLDLVLVTDKDGVQRAKGIITRNMVTGKIERWAADAVVLATGGYSNVFFLSTNAAGCNVTAAWRAYKRGAGFANPCYTQIHPTCIPQEGEHQSKLTLMSESLRNDGRVWVPKSREIAAKLRRREIKPSDVAEEDRDYYLERKYPSFGNLAPRDISSRSAKEACDDGRGIAPTGFGVYLDFRDAIQRLGEHTIAERYGNLFDMYENITGTSAYKEPMMIYPAPHYTMGGLWVDYNLMTTIPGCFATGEANFSDHGANRLGASALMQGLADGYFVTPAVVGNYLGSELPIGRAGETTTADKGFDEAENFVQSKIDRMLNIKGSSSPRSLHIELGKIMLDKCGMARTKEGLTEAIGEIQQLRQRFWQDLKLPGTNNELNIELERAGRVADFLEFGELMCRDALTREESCGGHFRVEHQTPDGEALRHDDTYSHAAVWEYKGDDKEPVRHVEHLDFENVKLGVRSYK